MYNIVFIETKHIENNFAENSNSINELNKLKENILKLNDECINYIVITYDGKYEDEAYKINLLKAYFEILSEVNEHIIVGPVLTKDIILDNQNQVSLDDSKLSDKQYLLISSFDKETINKLVHISHGIDYLLRSKLKNYSNIVLTNSKDDCISPMEVDDKFYPDMTYLLSEKKGLEGFNDCFNTYYNNINEKKLTKI